MAYDKYHLAGGFLLKITKIVEKYKKYVIMKATIKFSRWVAI